MSDILRKGDAFQLKDGRGQFLSDGTRQLQVNGKMSFNRPNAFVHLAVAALLAEQLEYPLGSSFDATVAPNGFVYKFKETVDPEAKRMPERLALSLAELHGWLDRTKAEGPHPERMDGFVNQDGRHAITWMLEALFNTTVTVEHSALSLSWIIRKPGSR